MTPLHNMSDDELWKRLADATDSMRPELLQQLGWRCIRRDEWGEAIALLEEAKDGYEKLGVSSDARLCTHWIARCHAELGDADASIRNHMAVVEMKAAEGPLDEFAAKTLDAIGCEYRDSGRHLQAANYFGQAARVHDVNGSEEFAENSGRKWMDAITRTDTWADMPEASDLVLKNSTSIEAHVHVLVSRTRAQLAMSSLGYDIDAMLAKAERLNGCQTDIQSTFAIELARIAVMISRGNNTEARERAFHGRHAAIEMDEPVFQAQFLLAIADAELESNPDEAREMLVLAQELGEVLKSEEIIDHAATSMMQLREQRLANPQLTLWEAALGEDAA